MKVKNWFDVEMKIRNIFKSGVVALSENFGRLNFVRKIQSEKFQEFSYIK